MVRHKISQQSQAQAALSIVQAVLMKTDIVKYDFNFYVSPRLQRDTSLYKMPFANIFPLTRRMDEHESPRRYLSKLLFAIDIACLMEDFDEPQMIYEYEELIENAIFGEIQVANYDVMLPTGMEWVKFRYLETDYDVDESSEQAVSQALMQFEARYVKVRS